MKKGTNVEYTTFSAYVHLFWTFNAGWTFMTPIIPRWKHIPRDTPAGYTARVSPYLHSLDANFPFGLDYYLLLEGVDIFYFKKPRSRTPTIGCRNRDTWKPICWSFSIYLLPPLLNLAVFLWGPLNGILDNLLVRGHWCSLNFLRQIYKDFFLFPK